MDDNEAAEIVERFTEEYVWKDANDCVFGAGLIHVNGEPCIEVYCKKELPAGVTLPETYEKLRVVRVDSEGFQPL